MSLRHENLDCIQCIETCHKTIFYFVSKAQKYLFLSPFLNFQISMVLIIFLHRTNDLLLKYDTIIFLCGIFCGFRILLNIQISMVFMIFLHRIDGLLLKYDLIIYFSGILSGFRIFSGFFWICLKSSDFNGFDHISFQNWWFTSQIWYHKLISRILSRFRICFWFFQIHSFLTN